MENMEQVNQKYRELCTMLGDIIVKMKGLENQKASIFSELDKLDKVAGEIHNSANGSTSSGSMGTREKGKE